MNTEPRTQREILAALHMPVPNRNCCNDMLDDTHPQGFGARHLALVIVTFTFSVMCLSVLRSGSATRSVGKGKDTTGLVADDTGLSLHYVDFGMDAMVVYSTDMLRTRSVSFADVEATAASNGANLVAFVGRHTADDTQLVVEQLKRLDRNPKLHYVLSVSLVEESQSHESLFADSMYFSVISRKVGLEVLSARGERIPITSSAISARLRNTPTSNLVLMTESELDDQTMAMTPSSARDRMVLLSASDKGTSVVVRRPNGSRRDCPKGAVLKMATPEDNGKRYLTYHCLSNK